MKRKIIPLFFMVLISLGGILSLKTISNYNSYLELNAAMVESNIQPYEENNYLVKDETLEDMKNKITSKAKDFSQKYEEEIDLAEENEQKVQEIVKSEKEIDEKLVETKDVYNADTSTKITALKEETNSMLKQAVSYNSKEEEEIEILEEELETVQPEEELDESLKEYTKVKEINKDVNSIQKEAADRIEEEELEAKKEKEEEAKKEQQEQEELEAQQNATQQNDAPTQSAPPASAPSSSSGNFDRGYAQGVFDAINVYRTSLGLPAYSYNSSMQSCVDSEASAYAANGNPHNYVCQPISGENAGITVSGYYSPAGMVDLWKMDQPHNRPMVSTSNTQAAVSAYKANGMIYIEACFW